MKLMSARVYVSRREKPNLSVPEEQTRFISHALKTCCPEAVTVAALAMSGKIRSRRSLLVPVPDSNARNFQNLELCGAIHRHRPEAVILNILQGFPRESQCRRDREGRPRFTADQIKVAARPIGVPAGYEKAVVYLVDNVCCTGATLEACRRAAATVLANEIRGLVYAACKLPRNTPQKKEPAHVQ